ncbi:transposase [Salicibibacter cibi]|uniref:Transposase n=1 Tax=Salicibibacter cibi TaxID=2743001 RepID=A0A7T7CH79_9BACI|nr:transposase [Salicibibacter cibi]QQK81935.1 transposase [Salicibibacter cibi]
MNERQVDHDRLFKELIQEFFQDLFFPTIHEHIDYVHLKFLDKEMITDVSDREKRHLDIVVETRLRNEDSLIIVHVEPQASYQPTFNDRMFRYFSRLYERHRRRIVPIAVFSYDEKNKEEPQSFNMSFPFLDVLQFNYLTVELKKLDWREYIRQDNPVAGALLSKMGYTEDEKIEVKKEFLRMLVRLELDPARNHLLTTFFETYLGLSEREEHILADEVNQLDPKEEAKVMELMTSYERKGIKKVALNLLSDGMDIQKVAKLTGLTEQEVKELKSQQSKND